MIETLSGIRENTDKVAFHVNIKTTLVLNSINLSFRSIYHSIRIEFSIPNLLPKLKSAKGVKSYGRETKKNTCNILFFIDFETIILKNIYDRVIGYYKQGEKNGRA
jgi:hypothetical protein